MQAKLQIEITKEAKDHLKALAYSKGLTLTEYILNAAADHGDAKAKKLIAAILENKNKKISK